MFAVWCDYQVLYTFPASKWCGHECKYCASWIRSQSPRTMVEGNFYWA